MCCMFGYTDEDKNNWIGDLFAFDVRKFLTLEACSPEYGHMLSINYSVQQNMACHKFVREYSVNIPMNLSQIML